MKSWVVTAALLAPLLAAVETHAEQFAEGSVIIPMDTSYQDDGMLEAYGLLYRLLQNDVPVSWVILADKSATDADFTASATDYVSGGVITDHGYRGGPFVIRAADAARAMPVIDAWQASHTTTVHIASASFSGDVERTLRVAPSIALFADGNEDIARKYLEAAGIPDSTGDPTWPDTGPDLLDPVEIAGPSTTDHSDGALFDADGNPVYCQLLSMHWGVNDAEDNGEVVAEVRAFLGHPTHFFAECQAVNAFENHPEHGHFLTPNGFEIGAQPPDVDVLIAESPYVQIDGAFGTIGGSEPSYTLPAGDDYKIGGITLLTEQGSPEGVNDVYMTGFLDGRCPPNDLSCDHLGKVSYLGGHEYDVALPISENPTTQGTRMFLNSLFEAPCATADGAPDLTVTITAPASTIGPEITFTIDYTNAGPGTALDVTIHDALPPGSTFVSATGGGQLVGDEVVWTVGNVGPGDSGTMTFTVEITAPGVYINRAEFDYDVGLNTLTESSNTTSTLVGCMTPADCAGALPHCDLDAGICVQCLTDSDCADLTPVCDPASHECTCVAEGCPGGDSDGDGLSDDDEIAAGTDPNDVDSDDDGVPDADELEWNVDTDGDGLINSLDPDSDNDGLFDGTEQGFDCSNADTDVAAGACRADGDSGTTTTNPLDPDTDGGGVNDGSEDTNLDGVVDAGETDPTLGHEGDDDPDADSDGDGLSDDLETFLGSDPNNADSDDDGVPDGQEPNPSHDNDGDGSINVTDVDSDNDGLFDGTELGLDCSLTDTDVSAGHCIADGDSGTTTTNPLIADTDEGGVSDGEEDTDGDGVVDTGERDPNDGSDDLTEPGTGGTGGTAATGGAGALAGATPGELLEGTLEGGGCSCSVPARGSQSLAAILLAAATALLARSRRRRR